MGHDTPSTTTGNFCVVVIEEIREGHAMRCHGRACNTDATSLRRGWLVNTDRGVSSVVNARACCPGTNQVLVTALHRASGAHNE